MLASELVLELALGSESQLESVWELALVSESQLELAWELALVSALGSGLPKPT